VSGRRHPLGNGNSELVLYIFPIDLSVHTVNEFHYGFTFCAVVSKYWLTTYVIRTVELIPAQIRFLERSRKDPDGS
jgi:hypothetical protein